MKCLIPLLSSLTLLGCPALAGRVALVIGNGEYESARLPNPPNDAKLIAQGLAKVGFKVIQKTNLGREAMMTAVREFSDTLKAGDVALFYYAGHGAQVKGENHLIPVDAPMGMKEFEAEHRNVSANLVLGALAESGSRLNIVILDCCRDNPFARSWRSANTGLAEMKAPQETLIGYATAPGSAALDGDGSNSPYSLALAEELMRPGLKLEEVFKNVARRVFETTKGNQRPWISLDVLGDFAFVDASSARAEAPTPPRSAPSITRPTAPVPKPVTWTKGTLKAELQSFTLQTATSARAVVKVSNTSPDKAFKVAFDWENPGVYSPNPPPGSYLHTAGSVSLPCLRASGIIPLTYMEASQGRGVLASSADIIDQASDLDPQSSVTLTLDYGLVSDQRGFGLSTDRDTPATSKQSPAVDARHSLSINLWHAEIKGEDFGRVTRVSVLLNDIPQAR